MKITYMLEDRFGHRTRIDQWTMLDMVASGSHEYIIRTDFMEVIRARKDRR